VKYLISVIDDLANSGTAEELAEIDKFNSELQAHGHLIFAGGLAGPKTAVVIDNRKDRQVMTRGPLFDAPENVSGFWIVELPSEEMAHQVALAGSKACNRRVELRKFLG
jgi:hypothetical protein